MNRISVSALTLAVATLAAGHAMAADSGKTRAQVEAERQQAVHTGAVAASIDGYGNQLLNEVFPGQYPATAKAAGKTRAEVEAERQLAVRTGALNQYPAY